VRAGDYVHAVADQGARDVALTLSDPQGRRLLQADSYTAEAEPRLPAEEIHRVVDAPGEIRIILTGPPGPCDLRLAEHRPATAADRERALAEAELAQAHALRRTHDPKACRAGVAVYESAERRFVGLGLPRRQAEAFYGLGVLQRNCLHAGAAALLTFTRAEPLFAGAPAFEAKARGHRGELRQAFGDLAGATAEYRRALELLSRLDDRSGEVVTADDLGVTLHQQGHYDEAAAFFDRSLALWRPEDGPGRKALTLLNRGLLYRDLGQADPAGERFREALPLFRQAKEREYEAATLNALGLLAKDAGRFGEALEPLEKALALRAPGSRGRAVTLTTLGAVYRQLGRAEDARRAYAEALPVFSRLGETREQARCLGNLGRLEAGTHQDAAALEHLDRALELFRTLADPPDLAWALEGKARVLRRRGDLEAARGLMGEALDVIEEHRFRQASYNTRADFFATRQDYYGFLIDLLMEMGRKDEALEVNERSLARSLLDGLAAGGMDLQRGTDPKLRASERELEREIDLLVSRQTLLSQAMTVAPERMEAVERELGRRWDELDRVRAALRTGDPRYAALTQPQPWKAADIQRRLLDRGTLLLEYRLGEPRSRLWAVTPDSLESFEIPGRAEIERAARAGSWTRRGAEVSAGLQLATLGRLLLAPVARLLPGKHLLVVGDGILQSLPFAALPEPGTAGPLIARHEIVSLPSVSVLGEIRREVAGRSRAPKILWALANPDFGRSFDPLPYTGEEAARILELVPASDRFEVQGPEATRAAVLGGPLRDFRFLHFATHGSFDATDPGGGRLVFAQVDPRGRPEPNGFLYLPDIYELNLRADLVVLSACQSALGKEVRGEGMMGMTRGFFYAGAERVLVSLWNVNDRVSVELMRRFYHGILKESLSPAAALRKAQDEIRSQERWRSPYYWAGFTLQGEWRGEGGMAAPSTRAGPPESRRARSAESFQASGR
jgi:CHAT domain-containing protein